MNWKKLTEPEKWILTGIPVLFLAGSLLHFLYDLSGENLLAGLFSPVNESIWEHTKLVVLPVILWWTLYYFFRKDAKIIEKDRWFEGALGALVTAVLSIPALFYLYTGALGRDSLWADILILLLSLAFGQLLGLHLYRYGKGMHAETVLVIFAGILVLFAVFTFLPPKLPLFQDPVSGGYGKKI